MPLDVLGTSDEQGNIAVLWTEGAELWLCTYSADAGSWAEPTLVPDALEPARWSAAAMSGGAVVASFSTLNGAFLTYYDEALGWDERATALIGPTDSTAVTIDARGNALALQGDGQYRRYVPELGWQEPQGLDAPLKASSMGVFAARDGSAIVVGSSADDAPEQPLFLRFE